MLERQHSRSNAIFQHFLHWLAFMNSEWLLGNKDDSIIWEDPNLSSEQEENQGTYWKGTTMHPESRIFRSYQTSAPFKTLHLCPIPFIIIAKSLSFSRNHRTSNLCQVCNKKQRCSEQAKSSNAQSKQSIRGTKKFTQCYFRPFRAWTAQPQLLNHTHILKERPQIIDRNNAHFN